MKNVNTFEDFINESNDSINESQITPSTMTVEELTELMPDKKDIERAEGLRQNGSTFYGNNAPWAGKTRSQLKAIKDPLKLVRRCKAFITEYGYGESVGYSRGKEVEKDRIDIGKECEQALREMGFSSAQVEVIRKTCEKK